MDSSFSRVQTDGYSATRIALHWVVVILLVVQYIFHEGMVHVWHAFEHGKPVPTGETGAAYFHAAVGILILVLALLWLWLRFTRGKPPLPVNENAILKFVARLTHLLLYLLIVVIPLFGIAAWFFGIEGADHIHVLLKNVLLFVAGIHVLGALFQQFVLKSGVLMRMIRPARA